MMSSFGWAKFPMLNRISGLRSDIPITFIYGARSWIDRFPGKKVKELRGETSVEIHVNILIIFIINYVAIISKSIIMFADY